jgi:hypothetical protein
MKIQKVGKLYKISALGSNGKPVELTLTRAELSVWFDRIGMYVIGMEGPSLEE